MRAAGVFLAKKGFLARSIEELQRMTRIMVTQEGGIYPPTQPREIISFEDPDSIELCKTMSDADLGGFSKAKLEHVEDQLVGGYARFSGFAGFRMRDPKPTIFGSTVFDLTVHPRIALRVKTDGRQYFVNIQTEGVVNTDIHQQKLITQTPGKWETVILNLHEFVRTNSGAPVEPQSEMMIDKIRTVGLSSIDRIIGPFELCIQRIWATREELGRDQEPKPKPTPSPKQFGSLRMREYVGQ